MKRYVVLLALVSCARHVELGGACAQADECGRGADCYHGVCTSMCADDSECAGELVCARHHCLLATGEPRHAATDEPPAAPKEPGLRPGLRERPPTVSPPNMNQDVIAELRAIHAELQEVKRGQQRLQESIDRLEKAK